jgi:putative transposase
MKRSKFTEAQIAFILQQAEEGTAVGEVCRKAGIREATFYNWRKKYVGLMPSEMKRLRQLEEENGKLKKIVADLSLDKAMLQDVESYEACPAAANGGPCPFELAGEHSTSFACVAGRTIGLPLPLPSRRADATDPTDQGDRGEPRALWLSAHSCSAAPGRLAGECKAGVPALSRVRPAIAQQNAQAGQGEAAG